MNTEFLIQGVATVADPVTLLIMLLATFLGMIVGALPGLGTVTALAMMLPFTFVLTAPQAIGMLLAIYCSSIYGGSIPAVLINVPGTPQSAATVFDGYPMAKKGLAAEALGWVTMASFIGGVFSLLVLMVAAPQLAAVAVKFGAVETFALLVFSLTTIAWVSAGNPMKGLLAGLIGVLLSMIGQDEMSGVNRFTFDIFSLSSGLHIVPLLVGLFALSEVFAIAGDVVTAKPQVIVSTGFKIAPLKEWALRWVTVVRSSVIGTFLGILPGVGATAASLISYAQARASSPRKDRFGHGEPEGIIASEASNNAVTGGALVPTLALGIPGDAATAVMLGALIIHGVSPGVQLFTKTPDLVGFIFIALLVANIMMLIGGALFAPLFGRVLRLPNAVVMAIVVALSLAGAYVIRSSLFDVATTVIVGILGWFLRQAKVPVAPIVIGFILGTPLEVTLRQSLILHGMDPLAFFASPIASVIFGITAMVVLYPLFKRLLSNAKK